MKATGYRCVNFHELCRLCCSPASGTSNGIQIFETEGGLQKKIMECLSITLNENDKLPKTICSSCKEYVEVFSEFRKSSKNAQKMLEGCLNTSKLRNGGQVYIKDEIPVKKTLKPIQNTSPTKLVPNLNLCNIITATTPTKQVKKNVIASSSQPPDFLSSIMQAVGIQTGDDTTDTNNANNNSSVSFSQSQNLQQQSIPMLPQYTLTLDGNTMKSGQIQYKIENTSNMLSQTPLLTARNIQDIQNQQVTFNQVDEFLKLKQMPGLIVKKDSKNNSALTISSTPDATNNPQKSQCDEEPKDKKPKFNLILQAAKSSPNPTKIHQTQIISPQPKATTTTFTSPNKAQILNIEKFLPVMSKTSPTKQLVVPIMVRSDGNGNAVMSNNDAASLTASQLLSKALSMSGGTNNILENKAPTTVQQPQQPVLMQMKLQPNADGQLTLYPVQTASQQPLQLTLSPQQLQQLNLQAISNQTHQSISIQPTPLTVQSLTTTTVNNAQDIQTQTAPISNESQNKINEDDNDQNNDVYDDDFHHAEDDDDQSVHNDLSHEKTQIKKTLPTKKVVKNVKNAKIKTKMNDSSGTDLQQSFNAEHSDMAKKQLNQLTSFNSKRAEATDTKSNEVNLTVCEVCKKIFKRKEFLIQHLKSHIGLRPFKCTDPTCNKAFSRKEHLLRHISSHTGTKEFICNVCNKLFSRKDNLNKHKRIHPESNQQGVRHK